MTALLKVLVLAVILMFGTAGAALATHGNPGHEVEITGYTFGTDTIVVGDSRCAQNEWRYQNIGTGWLDHLGAVDVLVTHCSRLTSETTGSAGPGEMTITAANGDRLYATETATFALGMGDSGPVSVIDLAWTITGGTGRFAHATGSGHGSGLSLLLAGTTSMNYWGTISYDASDRSGD